jgi:hypothetical protein
LFQEIELCDCIVGLFSKEHFIGLLLAPSRQFYCGDFSSVWRLPLPVTKIQDLTVDLLQQNLKLCEHVALASSSGVKKGSECVTRS